MLGFKTERSDGYICVIGAHRLKQVILITGVPYLLLSVLTAVGRIHAVRDYMRCLLAEFTLLFLERCILLGVFASMPDPGSKAVVVTTVFVEFIMFCSALLLLFDRWTMKGPVVMFSCIAVPALVMYGFLSLPVSAPDSYSHIVSAYRYSNLIMGIRDNDGYVMQVEDYAYLSSISEGYEFGKTTQPDYEIYETQLNSVFSGREDVLKDVMVEVDGYYHMSYYSVLCWFPQVVGLTIGRLMKLNPFWLFSLPRILSGLIFLAVVIEAIRITPIGKYTFCAVALFPSCLNSVVSFNYDSMVIISSIGFLASIFSIKYSGENKRTVYMIEAMIYAILLGGVKGGGFVLLVLLAITWSIKPVEITRSALIILSGIISYVIFNKILPSGMQFFQLQPLSNVTMPASYSLYHPVRYLSRIIYMYVVQAQSLFESSIGLKGTPGLLIIAVLGCLVILILLHNDYEMLIRNDLWMIRAMVILGILATPATILVGNVPEIFILQGVQGRYYLPMILLGLMLVGKRYGGGFDNLKNREGDIKLLLLLSEALSMLYVFFLR